MSSGELISAMARCLCHKQQSNEISRSLLLQVLSAAILMVLLFLSAGCGGGEGTFSTPPSRQLIALDVQPSHGTAVQGGMVPFSATGTFDQAPTTQQNIAVQWTSSDTTIATIDTSGVATCIGVGGTLTITASSSGKGGMIQGTAGLDCLIPPEPVTFDPTGLQFVCRQAISAGCQCVTSRTTTLTNNTDTALVISSIVVGGSTFSAESTSCGDSVGAQLSCDITVHWTPGPNVAIFSGTLTVNDNASTSPQKVFLRADETCHPL
jgi:hypothetical protein